MKVMQPDTLSRREFLARAWKYSSLAVLAMSFGYEAAACCRDREKSTALLYATRYGATKDTAKWIRKGMEMPLDLLDIERISIPEVLGGYDRFIVGSGIWIMGAHPKVLEFFETGRETLQEKLLGTFIVCGSADGSEQGKQRSEHYFNKMHTPLLVKPPLSRAFGGRMVVSRLSEEDRTKLTAFYKNFLNQDLLDWDLTDPGKAKLFGINAESFSAHTSPVLLQKAG
ncbi:MAG: hypothetical protein HGB36_09765 [Chlorobiaceae bacterium]|jgi:menaquinone-dependent protoporphyrinogen IX oxidase|nr:hypothetical protein [Chlorobiaceae bacterium]